MASFQVLPREGDTYVSTKGRRYKVREVIFNNQEHTAPTISVVLYDPAI